MPLVSKQNGMPLRLKATKKERPSVPKWDRKERPSVSKQNGMPLRLKAAKKERPSVSKWYRKERPSVSFLHPRLLSGQPSPEESALKQRNDDKEDIREHDKYEGRDQDPCILLPEEAPLADRPAHSGQIIKHAKIEE